MGGSAGAKEGVERERLASTLGHPSTSCVRNEAGTNLFVFEGGGLRVKREDKTPNITEGIPIYISGKAWKCVFASPSVLPSQPQRTVKGTATRMEVAGQLLLCGVPASKPSGTREQQGATMAGAQPARRGGDGAADPRALETLWELRWEPSGGQTPPACSCCDDKSRGQQVVRDKNHGPINSQCFSF